LGIIYKPARKLLQAMVAPHLNAADVYEKAIAIPPEEIGAMAQNPCRAHGAAAFAYGTVVIHRVQRKPRLL
jgi:hypothetical protein